jgi:hypothetical protein
VEVKKNYAIHARTSFPESPPLIEPIPRSARAAPSSETSNTSHDLAERMVSNQETVQYIFGQVVIPRRYYKGMSQQV